MANNVTIDGATVDADDPCALAKALVKAKLKIISGGGVNEVRVQDFNGSRSTRFSNSNLAALDAEIARQTDLCARSTGKRPSRYALRAGNRRFP